MAPSPEQIERAIRYLFESSPQARSAFNRYEHELALACRRSSVAEFWHRFHLVLDSIALNDAIGRGRAIIRLLSILRIEDD
jgi:hypothetical protein